MCGILGIISRARFSVKTRLLGSLSRLEYRGYDSAGFATREGFLRKSTGYLSELISKTSSTMTDLAISHTRWATHGGISEKNAHPHHNSKKDIFVVHNGIIENYEDMRSSLSSEGYRFTTDTDTEVIAHYFDHHLKKGRDMRQAMLSFQEEVQGTFAILIIRKGEKKLYAMKRASPLVMGISEGELYLASDIYAFINMTDKVIFFEDNENCIIDDHSFRFFDHKGRTIKKKPRQIKVSQATASKEKHDHYMIKEIKEQPEAAGRLIGSIDTIQKDRFMELAKEVKKAKRVVFLACGTSYHASLIGVYLLNTQGIESHTVIASEFENFLLVDKDTLVIAISQSGETMDVVAVLKDCVERGARIASIVNVPFSTIQRLSRVSVETMAGPEICVASTKVFTNQVISLLALAKCLGYRNGIHEIPGCIKETIGSNERKVKALASRLESKKDIFCLGKGLSYPIAREIALKLKEIPYIHAEGMMAGELKHGTIALIEPGIPVISLIPNKNQDMLSSTNEVRARGADIITITNTEGDLVVPESDEVQFTIYSAIVGHLLSYYIAKKRKLPIDKPRNLAKSVTVK